jgi:hypothetical protein
MPFLAYDIDGTPHAGRLTRRALVGRRLSHGVVLSDPGVSRLHAWVDPTADGGWVVTDAGSKTGMTVNGQRRDRHDLHDGDVILVGATRITFRAHGEPPPGVEADTLSPPPGQPVRTSGILFTCACGAPIWVGNDLAGKRGRCRHCKRQVVVPVPGAPPATPAAPVERAAPGRRAQCGVCHAVIGTGEALTTCPECETTFHAECWTENYGCSTYGCGHVNVLNPDPTTKPVAPAPLPATEVVTATAEEPPPESDDDDDDAVPPSPQMQWEWVTVLAALVASAVGVLAFGVPPLAVAVVAGWMIARRRPDTRVGLLVAAIAVAVVGVAVGILGSEFLFFGRLP